MVFCTREEIGWKILTMCWAGH